MELDLIARTSGILLAGSMIAALLRRAAPSTRHLVWHFAIVAVLLTPLLAPLAPKIAVPMMVRTVPNVPMAVVPEVPIVAGTLSTGTDPSGTIGTVRTLGTGAVLSWFLFCWLLSGLSVWRGSKPAPELWLAEARTIARRLGMKSPVAVRQLLRETTPHVAGFFGSVVMMPPSALTWTHEARQAALVHELTHIKRGDRRTQALAQLASAIYWFNPLVWYAAAGLARERERACDDEVLKFGAKPSEYATLLLDLARRAQRHWTPATALGMARPERSFPLGNASRRARPSAIEGRLLSILADAVRTPRRSTRWLVGFGIITITAAILGAQAAAPAVRRAEPEPTPIAKSDLMALDDQGITPSVTKALVEALRDADGQVREQATMGLAITPGAEVIAPLLKALTDPDAQVREKAAIGLVFRRDPRIVAPLLTAIEDRDAQVREKAAIALGASGDARAVPALTKASQDPDSQVREKAVAGLILLGMRPSTGLRAAPSNVEGRR